MDDNWWGKRTYRIGQGQGWQLANLQLRITRASQEWQLEYHQPVMADEEQQACFPLPAEHPINKPVHLQRYLFDQTSPELTLLPRLADRSVVVRPMNPIIIPPGEKGTLYVSTPLWVAGYADDQRVPLFDLPMMRMSDSWFGSNTLQGSLCYATPVNGHTTLTPFTRRASRAVTPIVLHNHASQPMLLQRINLPAPALSLYRLHREDRWWTPMLEVIQESTRTPPRVRIESQADRNRPDVEMVQPARHPEGTLSRVFESLFD